MPSLRAQMAKTVIWRIAAVRPTGDAQRLQRMVCCVYFVQGSLL